MAIALKVTWASGTAIVRDLRRSRTRGASPWPRAGSALSQFANTEFAVVEKAARFGEPAAIIPLGEALARRQLPALPRFSIQWRAPMIWSTPSAPQSLSPQLARAGALFQLFQLRASAPIGWLPRWLS